MAYKASNNATSTLAGPLTAGDTSLSVQTGHGDRFPQITAPDYTYLTFEDTIGNIEIIKVTARVAAADAMTIERGQLGTSARSWLAGDLVECRPLASLFESVVNHLSLTAGAHNASAITSNAAGGIAATNVQAALEELDTEKLAKAGGNITGEIQLTGDAGTAGEVMLSQGVGAPPIWGAPPSAFATTVTGTGDALLTSPHTAEIPLYDLAAQTDTVDYRIANSAGTEYEVGTGSITYTNTGGVTWTESFGDFDGQTLNGMAYGAGVRVVVGNAGKVLSSTDNINWTLRDGGFSTSVVYGVIFAGSQFIAFGASGKLATSPDGIVWTQRASAATAMASGAIQAATYNGTTYAICGAAGYIASSTDGITWTNRKSTGDALYGMAWGNGYFIAGGAAGAMFASTDGTTWNTRTSGFGATQIVAVAYGLVSATPTFVAVGASGTATYSTDGTFTTWASATSGFGATTIRAITFAEGLFVAVGDSGKIAYDADGQGAWTLATSNTAQSMISIGHNGTDFIAAGGSSVMVTSADGITWARTGTKLDGNAGQVIAYGNSLYVLAGNTASLSTSPDGVTWTERSSGFSTDHILAALYGGKWVICGYADKIATSTDGLSWTAYSGTLGASAVARALAYGNSVYVVAGDTAKLSTSATALSASWTSRTSGFTADIIYGVAYALIGATHTFVAVGAAGKIASSTDGSAVTWTLRTSPVATQLSGVAYGNGRFVAVGTGGVFLYSVDGTTWYQAADVTSAAQMLAIGFFSGIFVAVSGAGHITTSPDGITWTLQTSGWSGYLSSVTSNGSVFSVTGIYGATITSPVGVTALKLARSTPYFTSNANGLVSFAAGSKSAELIPTQRDLGLTTTTTGTGDLTLASFKGSGALLSANGNAIRVAYRVADALTWESGIGTLTNTAGIKNSLSLAAGITVQSVLFDGTKFMAYGATQTYAYSYDGVTWTTGSLTYDAGGYTSPKLTATFINGLYLLSDNSGYIFTSTDGVSWTRRTNISTGAIDVAYGNGYYVAIYIGQNVARYSQDSGVTWTAANPGTNAYGIAFGAGTFVLTTGTTTYYTSKDGTAWTSRTMPGAGKVVRYVSGRFVAVGTNLCYTSPDGINWTSRSVTVTPASLTYGNGLLIALPGSGTSAAYSKDGGTTWAAVTLSTDPDAGYYSNAYGNGRFVTALNTTQPTVITPAVAAFTLRRGVQESSNSNLPVNFIAGTKQVLLAPYASPDADTTAIYTKQTAWVPAGAMVARTTNGAAAGSVETATNKVMISTLDFDTTTQEFAQFQIAMPKGWIEGAISAQVVWSHAATTTNFGVAWEISAVAVSDDDALDAAFSTAVAVTDTGGTTNDLYMTIETLVPVNGTPQPLDTVIFQIARAPANAADTMAIDARLHGVRLYYYTDTVSDA